MRVQVLEQSPGLRVAVILPLMFYSKSIIILSEAKNQHFAAAEIQS